jgi:hypothetical protein
VRDLGTRFQAKGRLNMIVVFRLGLLGVFLLLLKEGLRLAFASLFLMEAGSPFPIIYGVVVGIAASAYSVVCVAVAFRPSSTSVKVTGILVMIALALTWATVSAPNACDNLLIQTHAIELLTCQRLPRLSLGFALFSILISSLWFTGRK